MKIVLAFALLIVIAKANPFEDARIEEQEELFEPEERSTNNLRMLFEKFDKDNNGYISRKEFKKNIKSLMKKLGKDIPTNQEITEFFDRIDSNGDGKIDFKEFKAIPEMQIPKKSCWCELIRDIIDWIRGE